MITATIWIASLFGTFLLGAMVMAIMASAKRGDALLEAEFNEFERMLNGARQQ